jgi:flavin-dependent dehydrogenase
MLDVVVAGAGPAGSVAALTLARAGVRVLVVDRDEFPRDKLCGDTLNPGALGLLAGLGLQPPAGMGLPLAGMLLTGPSAAVRAEYGGVTGLSLERRVLDRWLLDEAIRAGARFEGALVARRPLIDDSGRVPLVRGLLLARRGDPARSLRLPATLTIAADGRGSAIGRALGLVAHPRSPRRWAFGAYMTGVEGVSSLGEMHIRGRGYIGIAPVGPARVNVCVVTGPRPAGRTPREIVERALAAEPGLQARFARAEFVSPVRVLGPLAVDAPVPGTGGLLLAGDAAGFIDPMTGDGLHLAMRGSVLAAAEALRALETGQFGEAVWRLARERKRQLGPKLRFNRVVRRIVESPIAVGLASWGSHLAPAVIRRAVRYAGDAA